MAIIGVKRFKDVKSLIEAVKEIRKTTEDAWVLVDNTVEIPESVAKVGMVSVFGNANAKWAAIQSLKETKEGGVNITFNIETYMPSLVFFGMEK